MEEKLEAMSRQRVLAYKAFSCGALKRWPRLLNAKSWIVRGLRLRASLKAFLQLLL